MKKIDTSDWSEVVIAVGSNRITLRTLQSEEWHRNFCDARGHMLISFSKGTSPYCAMRTEAIEELSAKGVGGE